MRPNGLDKLDQNMEIKIALILLALVIFITSFWGFLHRWSWKKTVKICLLISAVIAPLMFLDNYRIFVIAILIAVIFEFRKRR